MFVLKPHRIDVRSDSIATAILKKTDNKSLSEKTLNKLVRVANRSCGLTMAEAKKVFIKNESIEKSAHSIRLAFELKKVASQVSSAEVRGRIEGFMRNSNSAAVAYARVSVSAPAINQMECMSAAEFADQYATRIGRVIGEGAEAIVVEDSENNNKVIKIFFDDVKSDDIVSQVNSFRKFYGESSAQIISGRAIRMDKIKGDPLSSITRFQSGSVNNFILLVEEMIKKGCPPSDMSEGNFLYDRAEDKFLPVDIATSNDNTVDRDGLKYIVNYINSKVFN